MNGFIISCFLLSILNLVISFLFKRFRPREINGFVGYRTSRSMRSQEAWDLANEHSARLMLRCAIFVFVLQFAFYAMLDSEVALLTFVGTWIGCLIFTIIRTEFQLKRHGF